MRISRLSLKNVGPFDDATLELPETDGDSEGEIVLFEGPNGSGKTTIAELIAVAVGSGAHSLISIGDPVPLGRLVRLIPRALPHAAIEVTIERNNASLVSTAGSGRSSFTRTGSPEIEHELDAFAAYHFEHPTPLTWAAFLFHAQMPSAKLSATGPRQIS